mmetsp:Transcript_28871/g.73684  ORF Transcript_28871/g.73684 Transcript_28871/m.73684 type:complete len:352 (-) Transcript_28871:1276-2331(-)|eukprot:CAMPEP_0202858830 /NCGR_PEP_ID=MMETSP1391-20130828/1190_1 /ASSEMBLY_ACC=CAM_ASM_000867 /TAXON_ID=1034604 /ORGANISM="Chlamydomonas leiostraca, Strain SAG 11-49" /LENGTH=351 /DNA_ID=CAMNT_0049537791 /DNA_START=53 /DNA_END=1108 /DNA_ORIENTATION=+
MAMSGMQGTMLVHALAIISLIAAGHAEELLIGWKGETYQPQNGSAGGGAAQGEPWVETISWSPRAFIHHNFLTMEECDHIVSVGNKRVARSLVVDSKTGASKLDDIRTSYGAAFGRGEDAIIAQVEARISEWTHLPPEYGEPIQVLRYVDGQKYDAHWDWFDDPVHHEAYLRDGNRYATVLLYLAEVEEGGETTLPLAEAIDEELQSTEGMSACATKMGLAVKPRKGDALLFFDMDIAGGKGDRKSLHASCPTLKGTKWTATKWIHNKPYMGSYNALERAAKCADTGHGCADKVASGACDSDASLTGPLGTCRKSCGDCEECATGDVICARKNMRSRRRRAYAVAEGESAV